MTSLVEQTTATRTQQTKLPDFFIVGHAKSGTTALYRMLRVHPQIYMPDLKETRFFARELHPLSEPSQAHPDTLADYLALFADAAPEQRAGEASPSYLRSRVAAGRIAKLAPNARIIAILREPASFVRSLHLQLLQAHVETERDLGKALAMEEARRRPEQEGGQRTIHQGLLYSEHVRYVEQLRRYHDVFPRAQVLVLIYDDFRADNEGTVRRVLRFLEVDDTAPIEVVEANPSVRVRSTRLYGIVRALYLGHGPAARAVKGVIKSVTFRRMRLGALGLERRMQWGDPGSDDEELMLELRRRWKGEVLALSEYLDRDLVTQWGYRDLD
jgi:Sulfotransferase family